ncbi:MAG TPA: hypothetical protein VF993_05775 [Myxococcales bacterium]
MEIERKDLDEAVAAGILSAAQAQALWAHLTPRSAPRARFTGLNVAYYFGALVVIAAMGWLMTLGFQSLGPWAVCGIAICYALLFAIAGRNLWRSADTRIPGGLLYTMAVCMTPLAIWGLERGTGFWPDRDPGNYRDFFPWIRSSWIWMEMGTVLAALFALRKVRFPFLVAPLSVALWFLSMDLAAYLGHSSWEFDLARRVSLAFGLGMLAVAYITDQRTREDFAFWLYLFGLTAVWGSITSMNSGSELNKFLYCLLNIGFIALGALLRRRIFLVYGALGVNIYLVYLAWRVFERSALFPFALTLLGLGIIAAAVKYQKNRLRIDAWLDTVIPDWLRMLLPQARTQYL